MINLNLMGNIIGWPMFISGIFAILFLIIWVWANVTSVEVRYFHAKFNLDLILPGVILLWTLVGAVLIWGII